MSQKKWEPLKEESERANTVSGKGERDKSWETEEGINSIETMGQRGSGYQR